MEQISKYKAIDGTEFSSSQKCIEYENLIQRIDEIMKPLPPLPKDDNCNFDNGHGFIQHDKYTLNEVKIKLLKEMQNHINHDWIQQTIQKGLDASYVGRLLSDYNHKPFSKAWRRFSCIDSLVSI